MSEPIRVEVWSDIACPWCYLGKHRFAAGVAEFRRRIPEAEVEIESRSFELAPDTPDDFVGGEVEFLVKHKGMPAARVEEMLEQMTQLGESEGVEFRFDLVKHANTRRAHRVLHLAAEQGLQSEMQERLFRAYFTEGRAISDPETLAELGEEIGLGPDEVRDAFDDEDFGEAVERDITRARMLGVSGVPFWLIDTRYGISGAQDSAQVADALEQVWALRESDAE